MDDLTKKQELDESQIREITTSLMYRAHDWLLSGGRVCEGMKIYQTQEEEIFVMEDDETGVKLGMKKEVKSGGAITHLSFFYIKN